MSSLSDYIKTVFAATETTDFHTQMDLVGEQVVSTIQQLYSTKTNPVPTGSYNTLVSTLQPTDPYVAGSISTIMQAKILEGVIALQIGSAITPQITTLVTAFDLFLVEKFAVPI